jgi:hypothetical protein
MDRPRLYLWPLACAAAAALLVAYEHPPARADAPVPATPVAAAPVALARATTAPSAPLVPTSAAAAVRAETLREFARAADHAGDSALALDARRQADALVPTAPVPATSARVTPGRTAGRAAGRMRARGAAARTARPRAAGAPRRARPGAPRRRADARERRLDRLFTRAEGWLSGGPRVRRPSP